MSKKSSHYDWFKQGNNQNKNKSPKENAKVVWKFTKIFLFFSLFFISMWGCVQGIILRTDPAVGKGVELYTSSDEIAPSVTSVSINEEKRGNASIQEIYSFNIVNDNIWLNDKEDSTTLTAIKDELKSQGVNSLDQANKGGNVVIRFTSPQSNFTFNNVLSKNVAADSSNTPLTWSTASENPISATATKIASTLSQVQYWTLDSDDNTIKPRDDLQDQITALRSLDLSTPNIVSTEGLSPEDIQKINNRWKFNVAVVDALVSQANVQSFLSTDFSTMTVANNFEDKDDALRYIGSYNAAVDFVINSLDIEWNRTDSQFFYMQAAFGYTSNKYTPIASWGQAWSWKGGAGPFYGIFVYPISWVSNKLINVFPILDGWESLISIFLVVIMISSLMLLFSWKGLFQQTKTQELQGKKAVIDAKYEAYKGNKQMEMRKRQEISDLYKKEGISPLGSIGTLFVSMPFFLAMWRVIGGIQHLKGTTWLGINFAATSWRELFSGQFNYLWLMALTLASQAATQLYPRWLTNKRNKNRINIHQKQALKKSNKTQNIMMVIFIFISLIWSAGLQIYLFFRAIWQIIQTTIIHHIIVGNRKSKVKRARSR